MKKARLLLLEDDAALHETLEEFLEEEGFDVDSAFDGDSAEALLYERRYDLLILDVNVPGKDGFTLLAESRANGVDAPALFLTTRDGPEDIESGFESGADDYVRKPFALRELLLRIQSMLRRRFSHPAAGRMDLGETWSYDLQSGTLYQGDRAVGLADKPRRLLGLLLQRRGQVVSHEVIAEYLWDFEETASDDALRSYIKILRNLLGKERIISHKRTGYQFR